MTAFDNLFRLRRWQLDERQRYLADLRLLAERLRADADLLQNEAEEAARAAGISLDALNVEQKMLFIRPLIERRRQLERSAAEVELKIAEAEAAVAAAEQETKAHEIGWSQNPIPPRRPLTRRARRAQEAMAARAARKLCS